jgi:hypothetical protein
MALITKTYGCVTRIYDVNPIKLGVTVGRKASCDQEIYQGLKANGLEPGTELFEEAHGIAREAMWLTAMSRDWDAEDGLK